MGVDINGNFRRLSELRDGARRSVSFLSDPTASSEDFKGNY